MRIAVPLYFFAAILAHAQIVSVGAKAGIPLTNAIPDLGSNLNTGRWTVGPTVEIRLTRKISAEVDALYRSYSYTASVSAITPTSSTTATIRDDSRAWDFSFLAKYRLGERAWKPFLTGGYTLSHFSSDIVSICTGSFACTSPFPPLGATLSIKASGLRQGPTAGAGIEFKFRNLKVAPEIRYTHLNNPEADTATALVGFTF